VAEMEKAYTELQGEIDRVREELRAEYQKTGRSFPADWRHRQQDKADALKAVVAKAKAAEVATK